MTLPERYCCCDLRLGVFIYGIVITLLTLGGIGYISYVCTTLEPWDTQLLNFLIAANCISFILLILKCGCLIAGVAMNKLKFVFCYYILMWIDVVLQSLNGIFQLFSQPLYAPLILIVVGFAIYNLLCVKNLHAKLKLENVRAGTGTILL